MERVNGVRASIAGMAPCPQCELPLDVCVEGGFYLRLCPSCGWEEIEEILEERDTDPGDVPPDAT